jgi:hypothetical protein
LASLERLELQNNRLTTIPAAIADDVIAMTKGYIGLSENPLRQLPQTLKARHRAAAGKLKIHAERSTLPNFADDFTFDGPFTGCECVEHLAD